jgi:transposase
MKPFLPARELLESIPGFSQIIADIFIAETGGDMTQFPTPQQLASWAGVSPGSNESAGRVKSTKTRPGNRYLKAALDVTALNQARTRKTYLSAKHHRLASTRRPMKALVAVEHAMIITAWNMLTNREFYRDPGADHYTRHDPAKNESPRRQTPRSPRIRRHPPTGTAGRVNHAPQRPRRQQPRRTSTNQDGHQVVVT